MASIVSLRGNSLQLCFSSISMFGSTIHFPGTSLSPGFCSSFVSSRLSFGIRSLRDQGKPVTQRDAEPQLLAFEKTSTLVTTGIYHYIRHPLYSSLLLLTWGIFFKDPTGPGVLLALAATLFLVATAKADEAECIRFFGPFLSRLYETDQDVRAVRVLKYIDVQASWFSRQPHRFHVRRW